MKNIFPKLIINPTTYFLFLSFLLTGFIKNILLIFCIILIHELGHIFFLKIFKYEIEKVEIYPFGGLTTTNKYLNSPINKDIIIYFGGILFQIILYFIFYLLLSKNIIHEYTFYLFRKYNQSILLFNLLPIWPLDGSRILLLFFQKYISYEKSLKWLINISTISLFIFFLLNIKYSLNNYIIISYLLWQIFELIRKRKLYSHKFLLERYLYDIPYKKINHENKPNLSCLKKETLHFFKDGKKYCHEKELLRQKFDIQPPF